MTPRYNIEPSWGKINYSMTPRYNHEAVWSKKERVFQQTKANISINIATLTEALFAVGCKYL